MRPSSKRRLVRTIVVWSILLIFLCLALMRSKPKPHRVALTWRPPVSGVTIVSYNVYRSTKSGGPFVKIASGIPTPAYTDQVVNPGRTYFYVVTAIDQRGLESRYSTETQAIIP